ncbi:MAG: hypothetical protein ACLFUS_12435 [Candidatus Sumerlaeia bacterium]
MDAGTVNLIGLAKCIAAAHRLDPIDESGLLTRKSPEAVLDWLMRHRPEVVNLLNETVFLDLEGMVI